MSYKNIYYSDKYFDEHFEYRHVMLPKELAKQVPKTHLMSEEEWRRLGVQQSLGWVHYMIHEPEPHILLFRRPLPKDQQNELLSGSSLESLGTSNIYWYSVNT
ncbi:cyclin-dependent kinases regulatory subunit 2 [Microcaecilia unicolor]|uniref:Cyclin-dependent kinases regulatory subunit n=1 Tax=Microcaecilia unicolor TaxID=1415580 RepID=A0A6P7X6X5_9AMPH|nr:cyclin-dependent kinases regulatory subunit 2 [Microcaecilia unicolor]